MRLFVAIDLEKEIKEKVAERTRELAPFSMSASFPRKEGLHITLKFLGEVEEEKIPSIKKQLSDAARGIPPFKIEITGRGVFPSFSRPRVVWLGVKEKSGLLRSLYERIELKLSEIGFQREEREFVPHLTLARIKRIGSDGRKQILDFCRKEDKIGEILVRGFCLFQSILDPKGAIYRKLAEFKLEE